MNDAEIEAVVAALQRCVGVPLEQVWQPARDRVVLGLADGTLILMVPRGTDARIHTIAERPRNPPKPFSFQGACRARLGGPLQVIEKRAGDRVVWLGFRTAGLELRLTGRSGGLWLVEGETVVAAYDGPAPAELPPLSAREPRPEPPRFDTTGDADRAAREFFENAERTRSRTDLRARAERGLRSGIARQVRLLENLREDLARAAKAPELRRRADLLAGSLHAVPRGAREYDAMDWETGTTVSIELDPALPASAVMERLYKQAKRLDRVTKQVEQRIRVVDAELRRDRERLEKLDAVGADEMRAIVESLPREKRGGAVATSSRPYVEWVGPAGERVLVGRNAAANRKLTFQVARGTDWWMHVRGRPGAHLVLPMEARDRTPPLELLLCAAQIALVHAKLPVGEAAEVQYTRVRDVRAVPGEVGRVTVANEKVLRVVRDLAALVGWSAENG
jgi:predicted ribosome quality control (RQC) complex YloA/Tae2 family protein